MFGYDEDSIKAAHQGKANWGGHQSINWSNITSIADTVNPQEVASEPVKVTTPYSIITAYLGYPPEQSYSWAYEPDIWMLMEKQQQGHLDDAAFHEAVNEKVKLIRNDNMQIGGWDAPCMEQDYHRYFNHLTEFKDRAKQRLLAHLNYEPALEYRLRAELFLREQYLQEQHIEEQQQEHATSIDYFARTVFLYRKTLIEHGRDAANNLDPIG